MGFFDGASTKNMGGVGVQLMINQDHFFCFKLGLGHSTNTRSKLLALWTLLHCAKCMGLPHLQILGDSAVIINWFNHQSTLSLLTLDGWCHLIRELECTPSLQCYFEISFKFWFWSVLQVFNAPPLHTQEMNDAKCFYLSIFTKIAFPIHHV